MTERYRAGGRGSPLARAQTEEVLGLLRRAHPDASFETIAIATHGDEGYRQDLGTDLDGKRAFTKRVDDALLEGQIDFAVHSMKDLPAGTAPGLALAAVPRRADPRDVLVSREGLAASRMPERARIGTSSLRRRAQLLARWPDLHILELHGNVGTRLGRLDAKDFDGVVVAAAGLHRLRIEDRAVEPLPPEIMTPAPGQGALALLARDDDSAVLRLLSSLDHEETRRATEAERTLSARVGGGCDVPFGALATRAGDSLKLQAVLASPDGRRMARALCDGPADRPHDLADAAWARLRQVGADAILEART